MTELSIHIPRELAITADSIIEEQQIPLIAADRIGRGLIHPDRLPPSIPTLTQIYEAVLEHEGKTDPHPQYATDSDLTNHASDSTLHIPAGGISNNQIAAGAAIDWAKISKVGAVPGDIGAATSSHLHSGIATVSSNAPSNPSIGDRWLDTGDCLIWWWDGQYWRSEWIDRMELNPVGLASNASFGMHAVPSPYLYSRYLLRFEAAGALAYPQDSTNYWAIRFSRIASNGAATMISELTLNTQNMRSGSIGLSGRIMLNLHQDVGALSVSQYQIDFNKTLAPGAISSICANVVYQLVKR